MAGSFVADHARLAASIQQVAGNGGVHVVHALEWPGGTEQAAAVLQPPFEAVLDRLRTDGGTRLTGAHCPIDRVPVFTIGGAEWADRAEAAVRDVRRVLGPIEAPIVHGHVGYLGGVLAARLASPTARVFATEHSSALEDVLAQPRAADLYRELLERVEMLFCVSDAVRATIVNRFADLAAKTAVLHNPIDFSGAPRRAQPPTELNRWVFIGGLREIKGVNRMLEAFIIAAREREQLRLSVYGSGPLQAALESRLAEVGLADRVVFKGAVPHQQVLADLPNYELLVAPSVKETFHIAVPEAVAAGVPVIVTRSGGPQEALAGVEDQVGVFIDVAESPAEILDAWAYLERNLDQLDLDGARASLDARYGRAATTERLARAYAQPEGTAADAARELGAPRVDSPSGQQPARVVVPATSGWRSYHVMAEFDALRRLDVPTVVLSNSAEIQSAAEPLPVLPVDVVPADSAPATPVPAEPGVGGLMERGAGLARQGRRFAGLVKARVNPATAPTPRRAAAATPWPPFALDGATLLLTDCQSMPLAQRILEASPGLRAVVELDRVGPLGPAVDGVDGDTA